MGGDVPQQKARPYSTAEGQATAERSEWRMANSEWRIEKKRRSSTRFSLANEERMVSDCASPRSIRHSPFALQGAKPGGNGGSPRISMMVMRRFAPIDGSSGNNGWVSALPATMNTLVFGTPSCSRICRTLLARSADNSQAPYPGRDGRRVADV